MESSDVNTSPKANAWRPEYEPAQDNEDNPAQALIEVSKIVHGVLKVQELSKSIFGSPSHKDQVWEGPMVSSPKFGYHLIQGK